MKIQKIWYLLFILIVLTGTGLNKLLATIYINQVGYTCTASKYVFTDQVADSFYLVNTSSRQRVFGHTLFLQQSNDPATGLTIYRGDFSSFGEPGSYRIEIPGHGQSYAFQIGDSVYLDVYMRSLKALYFQRCGIELKSEFAGVYLHLVCHSSDALYHTSTDSSGYHDTSWGWHDAGDYGKYVVNACISAGTLLMGYEYFPEKFDHDGLNIPESGNQIPDVLDEVRFELEWLLKMQRPDGAVYFKVTPKSFESFIMPQNDKSSRYLYEVSSTATADFAALMARAGRIYDSMDSIFAQTCLLAAEQAWSFLEANPAIVPSGGFKNPADTQTGEYGDGDDRDERLWAAAELYETTGKGTYHTYFQSHYTQPGVFTSVMGWGGVAPLAHLTYLLSQRAGINSTIQSQLQSALVSYCQTLVTQRNQSGFQTLLKPGEYNWGSNSSALNKAILLIFAYKRTQQKPYLDAASDQFHYVLGVNAHNMTFITGIGDVSPLHPHHRPSQADGIIKPIPGLLIGGANQYLQDAILAANFNSSTPPALCYMDHLDSYASNEIAINWNAPLIFLAGYFLQDSGSGIDDSDKINLPRQINLLPNFPNPFNHGTTLPVWLRETDTINFKIFNPAGQMVEMLQLGVISAGPHEFRWQPGEQLASGIYYIFAEGTSRSQVRKMIYIK